MRNRLGVALAVAAAIVIVLLATFHNGAARLALSAVAGIATGYDVQAGDLRLEAGHGALINVRVTRGGQPVLDARRIDIYYNLRDLLPGSRHRFGLLAVTVDRPRITIIHHKDGTYNIALPRAVSGGTRGPQTPNNVPIDLTVRVRDASISLIDHYRYYKSSQVQRVDRVSADFSVNTAVRTTYLVRGSLEDGGPQPFRIAGTIDYAGGWASDRVSVRTIPVSTIGNYFINSPAAHILSGSVHGFDMHAWAFGIKPGAQTVYHIAGKGYMSGGSILVNSLDSPIQNIQGPITIFNAGFAVDRMTARVGHIPVVFSGGIFDFANPQFRLGVEGRGNLRYLKEVAHFANGLPIHGGVNIHALIEGDIANPIVLVGFDGRRFNYQDVPIDLPHGEVALYNQNLIVLPFHAYYSGIKLHIEGNLRLGRSVHSVLALHAIGSSSNLPYLGAVLPSQPILAEVLLTGDDLKVDARGYLLSLHNPRELDGFYAIDHLGRAAFGPISIHPPGGGSLVAGFDLDRPHGNSAFWASLRDIAIRQPVPVGLPGVSIPLLPPMVAHVSRADLVGTGSAQNVVVAGTAQLAPAQIAGVPFAHIDARFAGPFAAAEISRVRADGPWGRFDGKGTFAPNLIVARGNYRGTFAGLHRFLGNFPVSGAISGPVGIAVAQGKIFVQAEHARLHNATIHGIPMRSASATMAFENNILRIYAAQAHAAGGTVVAAGTFATGPTARRTRLALATTAIDAGALQGSFGVPISHGTLRAIGALEPGAAIPNLDAGVVLQHGRVAGYGPFAMTAELSIAHDTLGVQRALAGLGSTYAYVHGSIGNLAGGDPSYSIVTTFPAARIAPLLALAHRSVLYADGSLQGTIRIGGAGSAPTLQGSIRVPVGEINGLGFRDASAQVSVRRGGFWAQNGSVQVGSTAAHFSAALSPNETALSVRARNADLADFNDYFDTGDTLAGRGSLAFAFSHLGSITFTAGDLNLLGFRYRRLPIGDTYARWAGVRNLVQGHVRVGGESGMLDASGSIALAPSRQLAQLVARSRYDIDAHLSNLDLTTWLPALGYPQLPLTGRVDGAATVRGAYPDLQIAGNATLHNGTIGPLVIDRAQLAARSAPGRRIQLTQLTFALAGLQASGSGDFGLTARAPLHLQLHATTSDLPRLVEQISKKHIDLTGHFETTVTVNGDARSPAIAAGIDASGVQAYGVAISSFVGQVQLRRRDLVVRNAEIDFAKGRMTLAGSLPLQLNPFDIGPANARIAMDIAADKVDLSAFDSIVGNGTMLGGDLNGHLGVNGSVGNPQIFGQISTSGASYVSRLESTPITRTVAHMTFQGTHASLDRLHAQMGSGVLDGSGTLNFGGGLLGGPLGYAVRIATHGAQIDLPRYGAGTFDSTLDLQRTPGKLAQLRGDVAIRDAVLPFGTFLGFGNSSSVGSTAAGPPFNLGFDLQIVAGRNVHVRGGGAGIFGLDISGEGSALLAGTLVHPTLAGTFNSAGGTLTYIDHAFQVQTGTVTFDPASGIVPNVYAVATTHVTDPDPNLQRNPTGSADITVTVSGPVTNPKLGFTSNPAGYSDQQIIALLLPLGGLVGPIQFTDTGVVLPAGQLNGAPSPGTGQILPSILVRRENGTLSIGQEAFNILNAQFATGLLAPVESALGSTLGLSDVNLTVDYTGNVGINVRRLLGADFYAIYGTTFGIPIRQTFGFDWQPSPFASAQFAMFFQQGPSLLFQSPNVTLSTNPRATAGQAVQGDSGFTFLYQRFF